MVVAHHSLSLAMQLGVFGSLETQAACWLFFPGMAGPKKTA